MGYLLANDSNGLSGFPLANCIDKFVESDKIASFLCAKPSQSFHVVTLEEDGSVAGIQNVQRSELLINAGFFVFLESDFRLHPTRGKTGSGTVSMVSRRKEDHGLSFRPVCVHGYI